MEIIMDKVGQFLNDALRPWDKLNKVLAEPFAYQPDLSDATLEAVTIAAAIKHVADKFTKDRRSIDAESQANSVMSDVADKWKHPKIRNPARDNHLMVKSRFLVDDDSQFSFVRNRVVVVHATHGQLDFMQIAADAIRYWLHRLNVSINWSGEVLVATPKPLSEVTLYFDGTRQMEMRSVGLEFVGRGPNDDLVPIDPVEVRFVLLDHKGSPFQKGGA